MKAPTLSCLMIFAVIGATACMPPKPLMLGPAANAGPVTCDTDCKADWERAQLWIVKHSKWKIQTATDVLVETFNPTQYDASYGFTATKEPIGGGKYRITLAATCANFLGCDPREADVVAAFNHYVGTGMDVLTTINHGSAIQ